MSRNLKKAAAKAVLSGGLALAGLALASGTAHAFDPQPEPPTKPNVTSVNPSVRVGDGSVAVGSQAR
jgi:hypothetical protein